MREKFIYTVASINKWTNDHVYMLEICVQYVHTFIYICNQSTYHDKLTSTKWYYYQAMQLHSLHELFESSEDICYLKESQIADALANGVVAKVKIIDNHAVTLTSLIIMLVEPAATNKRPVSQLAEALGR